MKLPFKISLIAIIPTIAFILLLFYDLHNKLISSTKENAIEKEYKELDKLNLGMDKVLEEFKNIISIISISNEQEANSVNEIKKKFEIYFKSVPQISELKFISLNGVEFLGLSRHELFSEHKGEFYFNSDIFQIPLAEDRFFIGDFYFSEITGEMMVNISKKIVDINSGNVLGVLIAKVSLNDIQGLISDKLLVSDGIAVVNTNSKSIIYQSSETKILGNRYFLDTKSNKDFINVALQDNSYTILSNDYNNLDLNLRIFVVINDNNLFDFANKIIRENLSKLALIIILVSVVIIFFVRYMLKPLGKLTRKIENNVQKINKGYCKTAIDQVDEIKEINLYFEMYDKVIKEDKKKLENFNEELSLMVKDEVEKNRAKDTLLFEQTKMAAMGEMLNNIAHQWRQPLSVISTIASGIKLSQDFGTFDEKQMRKDLDIIMDNTQYLSETIDDFRKFFKTDNQRSDFSFKEVIDSIKSLQYVNLKNNGIELIEEVEDVDINGYRNELIQAILIILNNARDKLLMQDNEHKKKLIVLNTAKDGEDLKISIKDSGGGIDAPVIDKVFEPYFTTKHQSKGTGIGLFMAQEIITKHFDGNISVKNSEFEYENDKYFGAEFIITFPLHIA